MCKRRAARAQDAIAVDRDIQLGSQRRLDVDLGEDPESLSAQTLANPLLVCIEICTERVGQV